MNKISYILLARLFHLCFTAGQGIHDIRTYEVADGGRLGSVDADCDLIAGSVTGKFLRKHKLMCVSCELSSSEQVYCVSFRAAGQLDTRRDPKRNQRLRRFSPG